MQSSPRVIIIGAGIGGLTTAALLAKSGYDVTVLEAQIYPGGSASSFPHKGYIFESGATVAGGFQPNGPHHLLGQLLDIQWPIHAHDPAWVVHLPDRSIALTKDNQDVLQAFPHTISFWEQQHIIADLAWKLSAQGLPWPPADFAESRHLATVAIKNLPQDLRLIPFALSSVKQWLHWHKLAQDEAFVRFLDATLLISAQTSTPHVNALYGATALDLARQGVYHVEGGIGGLAETLANNIISSGGTIKYRTHVTRIAVDNNRVIGVFAKKGRRTDDEHFFAADFVIANTTPWSLNNLLGDASPTILRREISRRDETYGAFVLHIGVDDHVLPPNMPDHHQIVKSYTGAMGEGQTLFISLSPRWDATRAPAGKRAVTVSTHTHISQWWDLLAKDEKAYYARKQTFANEIINTIDQQFNGFKSGIEFCLPGTPVTYEFYTHRHRGMVGGFPQTSLFKARNQRTGITNLRLVGDSIFPGQSTAGVTLGGIRVAQDILRQPLPAQTQHKKPAHHIQRHEI